jgi:ABC-type transporter MlaC component
MIMRSLALLLTGWVPTLSASTIEPPEIFMQNTTNAVLEELKTIPPGEIDRVYAVIQKDIVPIVDIEYMAKWVVGRRCWAHASDEQQKAFQDVFEKLMSQTYASTLLVFKDKPMIYSRPMRVDYQKAKTIPVYCEIQQPNKESIQVIYQMRLINTHWKVFDVLVEGVSMLKGLQAQYEQPITQKGISGGIEAMQQRLKSASIVLENPKS